MPTIPFAFVGGQNSAVFGSAIGSAAQVAGPAVYSFSMVLSVPVRFGSGADTFAFAAAVTEGATIDQALELGCLLRLTSRGQPSQVMERTLSPKVNDRCLRFLQPLDRKSTVQTPIWEPSAQPLVLPTSMEVTTIDLGAGADSQLLVLAGATINGAATFGDVVILSEQHCCLRHPRWFPSQLRGWQ